MVQIVASLTDDFRGVIYDPETPFALICDVYSTGITYDEHIIIYL
jgi:hypothetical protein